MNDNFDEKYGKESAVAFNDVGSEFSTQGGIPSPASNDVSSTTTLVRSPFLLAVIVIRLFGLISKPS